MKECDGMKCRRHSYQRESTQATRPSAIQLLSMMDSKNSDCRDVLELSNSASFIQENGNADLHQYHNDRGIDVDHRPASYVSTDFPVAQQAKKTSSYLSLMGLVCVLTIILSQWGTCTIVDPILFNASNGHDDVDDDGGGNKDCTIDAGSSVQQLATLSVLAILLLFLFFNLRRGDPGYLTNDVMSRLDRTEVISSNNGSTPTQVDDLEADAEPPLTVPLTASSSSPVSDTAKVAHLSLNPPNNEEQQERTAQLYPYTRRKFCEICQIYPPLRSHHCNKCHCCVATFDHHCSFLGTCIGERNHFRFWMFLLLNIICIKFALNIIIISVPTSDDNIDHNNAVDDEASSSEITRIQMIKKTIHILAKIYMYTVYAFTVLLWTIHTYLLLANGTTFEFSKGSRHIDYLKGTNLCDFPFSQGLCRNIRMLVSRDDISTVLERIRRRKTTTWLPILWKMPKCIERDSEDWWNHPWQNKYWSCC